MTGNGKIARLPRSIRDELNRRLDDGEPGVRLVEWLNGQPEVRDVLQSEFGGRPINEQNLSEWKTRGFREWVRHREACEKLRWMTERADDLEEEADGLEISDRLGSILAAELANFAEKVLEEITDPKERWQRMQEFLRELRHLRYEDHCGQRIQLQRERWKREAERQDEEDLKCEEQERKNRLIDMCFNPMQEQVLAEMFGGGEHGKKMAELLTRITFDQPLPDWINSPGHESAPIKPNQTESNQIKPVQPE